MNARRDRRVRSFVKLLVVCGEARCDGSDGYCVSHAARQVAVSAPEARWLCGRGLCRIEADLLLPLPEARAWLRRQLVGAEAFAEQHRDTTLLAGGARLNAAESPLTRLASRADRGGAPFLAPHHLEAGERVRRLVERAALQPRTTMNYNGETAGAGSGTPGAVAEIGDMAVDARQRLITLRQTLAPDCINVVIDVCGFLKGLQQVEIERGWPPRSAKLLLRAGLDAVALQLGLEPEARGMAAGHLRGWRDRPERLPMFGEV